MFAAVTKTGRVLPIEDCAERNLWCPHCRAPVTPVGGHLRSGTLVWSHFRHRNRQPDCDPDHISTVREVVAACFACKFPGATVTTNRTVGALPADVLVEFQMGKLGWGSTIATIIRENTETKPVNVLESEYLDAGITVNWIRDLDVAGWCADIWTISPPW